MTSFDAILLIVFGISIFFAAYRGAIRELTSLVALGLAAFVAWMLLDPLLGAVGKRDSFFAIVFAAGALGVLSFGVLYFLATRLIGGVKLSDRQSTIDRVGGGFFGFLRAFALVGLAFLGYGYYLDEENQPDMVSNALLLPVAKGAAGFIESFAPERSPALPDPENQDAPDEAASEDSAARGRDGAAYARADRRGLDQLVTTVTTSEGSTTASEKKSGENPDDGAASRSSDPIAALAVDAAADARIARD